MKKKSPTEARLRKFVRVDKQTLIQFLYDFLRRVKTGEQISPWINAYFERLVRENERK